MLRRPGPRKYLGPAALALAGLALLVLTARGAFGRSETGPGASEEHSEVLALLREAEELSGFGLPKAARAPAQEAAALAERLGERGLHARSIAILGSASALEGEENAASESWNRALKEARAAGDLGAEGAVRAWIGLSAWRRGSYEEALEHLREAERLASAGGDSSGEARAIELAGRVAFKQARYDEALAAYRRALTAQERAEDLRAQASTLEDMGDVHQERGEYALALEHYGQALRASREMRDRRRESYLVTLLGRVFLLQGAYRRAIAYFDAARAVAEESADAYTLAYAHHHLGIAHLRLGLAAEALEHLREALRISEPLGDLREEAWARSRIADALAQAGDAPGALEAYRAAIETWERIGDERGLAGGLQRSARLRADLGEDGVALELLDRARGLRERSQPAFLPSVLAEIGRVRAERGERGLALRYADLALQLAREKGPAVLWSTAHSVSTVRLRLGLPEEALAALEESLAAIERLRAGVSSSDEVKMGFLDSKQEVYADAIGLLTDFGRPEEALEVAERARARAFLDLLGSGAVATEADPGSGWPEPGSREATRAATLEEIRDEARRRRTTVLEYFSSKDRLFVWLVEPDGTVRSAVSPVGRGELERLVERMRQTMQPGPPSRGAVEKLGKAAERSPSSLEAPDPRPALRRLWGVLIQPVSRWLPENPGDTVTIVPHGPLFLVSFASLPDGIGRYLAERHTLHYAPSVAVLSRTRGKHHRAFSPQPTVLIVGNPRMPRLPGRKRPLAALPAAEAEAREIGGLFPPPNVRTLLGEQARESLVRQLVGDRTILHFATHGIVFDDEPLESLVALAPDVPPRPHGGGDGSADPGGVLRAGGRTARLPGFSDRDGLWTAREVFQLKLRAELVTLSACNTAVGRVSGEGVAGLSRAFLSAGAPSVLASLWRVADVAGRFQMKHFYRALLSNGGRRAAALREAELATLRALRGGRLRTPGGRALPDHPLFWAPFVLIGEPR
jgi:CHAT domain-containing protein/tetratricopeptide (TPR) repeat protein